MQSLTYIPINESFADELHMIWSDSEVIKYTNIQNTCSRKDTEARIHRFEQHDVFAVVKDGELIGIIGCPCADMNKQQFGIFYQFKKSSWGHGYAKESVKWLLSYMKKYENAVILADVVTDNTASEKILINCGFKLCSTTNSVVHGQEVTINNYELKLK